MDWDLDIRPGGGSGSGIDPDSVGDGGSDDKQLLRLTICQALQSQYVLEQTRGIDRFLSPTKRRGTSNRNGTESGDDRKEADLGEDEERYSLTSLMDSAVHESSSRHLTAGFLSSLSSGSKMKSFEHRLGAVQLKAMVHRLGRELAAMGLSADFWYLSLTNKRSIILKRIVSEYEGEYRSKGMALLNTKTLADDSHSLLKVTVNSSVFFMR